MQWWNLKFSVIIAHFSYDDQRWIAIGADICNLKRFMIKVIILALK